MLVVICRHRNNILIMLVNWPCKVPIGVSWQLVTVGISTNRRVVFMLCCKGTKRVVTIVHPFYLMQ